MNPSDYTRGRARTDTEMLVQMFPELRARAFAMQGIDDYAQLQRVQDAVAKLTEGGDWQRVKAQARSPRMQAMLREWAGKHEAAKQAKDPAAMQRLRDEWELWLKAQMRLGYVEIGKGRLS